MLGTLVILLDESINIDIDRYRYQARIIRQAQNRTSMMKQTQSLEQQVAELSFLESSFLQPDFQAPHNPYKECHALSAGTG